MVGGWRLRRPVRVCRCVLLPYRAKLPYAVDWTWTWIVICWQLGIKLDAGHPAVRTHPLGQLTHKNKTLAHTLKETHPQPAGPDEATGGKIVFRPLSYEYTAKKMYIFLLILNSKQVEIQFFCIFLSLVIHLKVIISPIL